MYSNQEIYQHLVGLMQTRRNYQEELKELVGRHRYVVFYGCGAILNSIVETWNLYVGRRIDYCCDTDSNKWGSFFCGAKCLSPEELVNIKDECVVFVTIGEYEPVFEFLAGYNFPAVNLVFKYDLIASSNLARCNHNEIVDRLCETYKVLADEKSKKVFISVVNRILGDDRSPNIMANIFERDQYFPKNIIELSDHENFVDVGAFDGDTVKDFVKRVKAKFDYVYSFEIDSINYAQLKENVKSIPNCNRIKVFNLGVWDKECEITYSVENSQSTIGAGNEKGFVAPLDVILRDEKITFIKMDIEGAEMNALRGAQKIIRQQQPKLAICVYHEFSHLWEIPLYIKKMAPQYKIYLRHHTKLEYETVCYAIL